VVSLRRRLQSHCCTVLSTRYYCWSSPVGVQTVAVHAPDIDLICHAEDPAEGNLQSLSYIPPNKLSPGPRRYCLSLALQSFRRRELWAERHVHGTLYRVCEDNHCPWSELRQINTSSILQNAFVMLVVAVPRCRTVSSPADMTSIWSLIANSFFWLSTHSGQAFLPCYVCSGMRRGTASFSVLVGVPHLWPAVLLGTARQSSSGGRGGAEGLHSASIRGQGSN
jgi:hypothetical protein